MKPGPAREPAQRPRRPVHPAAKSRLCAVWFALHRAGRRRWLYPLVSAAAGTVVLVALVAAGGLPQPNVHDEFAYLLGAETFAFGRLANPPHPLWEFFETIHVISQPAYASKYQPGQSLFLALGRVMFGHPYWGVVVENALLFAALCWLLELWLAPGWALAGAALSVVSLTGGHYWAISYWGGSAPALAGALLLIAWTRIFRDHRMGYGWLAGTSAVLLFWTRPLEGGLLGLALAAGAVAALRCAPRDVQRRTLTRALPAFAAVAAAGLACQGVYNRAVTGSAWDLPYALATRQYRVAPVFWLDAMGAPKTYNSEALRTQHALWEPLAYQQLHNMTPPQRAVFLVQRLFDALTGIAPLAFILPLAFLFWRDRAVRFLLLAALAGAAALCLETWIYPHYLAPWYPLLLLLSFRVLRNARALRWRGWPAGAGLVAALLLVAFASASLRALAEVHNYLHPPSWRLNLGRERARLTSRLKELGGRHVVVVRYASRHDVTQEWVYNGADIDGAAVMWARDRGPQENRRLARYFAGRTLWLLEPDANPPSLRPLPPD